MFISKWKLMSMFLLVFIAGIFGVSLSSTTSIDEVRIQDEFLRFEIDSLQRLVEQLSGLEVTVTATMYQLVRGQTDSTPRELADGTKIKDPWHVSQLRYIAVSRDLLYKWGGPYSFDDYISVEQAGAYNGVWQIRDVMSARWTRRIDFLTSKGTKDFRYEGVIIRKYPDLIR